MEIHPNYTGSNDNYQNDVCLLHLNTPLNMDSNVQSVPLLKDESQSETHCIISGWGSKQVKKYYNYNPYSQEYF